VFVISSIWVFAIHANTFERKLIFHRRALFAFASDGFAYDRKLLIYSHAKTAAVGNILFCSVVKTFNNSFAPCHVNVLHQIFIFHLDNPFFVCVDQSDRKAEMPFLWPKKKLRLQLQVNLFGQPQLKKKPPPTQSSQPKAFALHNHYEGSHTHNQPGKHTLQSLTTRSQRRLFNFQILLI
jgi:hypothetical protein